MQHPRAAAAVLAGCFYSLFVSNSTAHPPPSQPARHAPPSPVIATPLAVQGQGGGDSSVLGPVLGGVLGGAFPGAEG